MKYTDHYNVLTFFVLAENLGCFGASKKKKDIQVVSPKENPSSRIIPRSEPAKGMELLWQPEVCIFFIA